jgi:ketosteroid isomerase-like protein
VDDEGTIRAVIEAANRQDIDSVAALAHDDFLGVVPPHLSAEPDTYKGPDGIRRYFELFNEIVDGLSWSVGDLEQLGDWILAPVRAAGTGRISGIAVNLDVVLATQIRDGKLFRIEAFANADEARRSLDARG